MPEKTITIRLPEEYSERLEKVKKYEEENYHFHGNTSDIIRLIIWQKWSEYYPEEYKNYLKELDKQFKPLFNKTTD